MNSLQSLHAKVTDNTPLYFRCVLFLTFLGHGFVSLGFSHGYELHHRIFESVNYFHWNPDTFLKIQGCWDIFLAFGILSGIAPRVFLTLAIAYLGTVATVAYLDYAHHKKSYWGIGEMARRFAWIFYSVFLLIYYGSGEKRFSLLRIGISFAFLAHGFASLGYFGGNKGQIELASQILPNALFPDLQPDKFMYFTGFSDVALGSLMLLGIFSRPAAVIGSCWLVAVVVLSFMFGFPEGLFRTAFFLSCFYVALDKRCHTPIWEKAVVEKGSLKTATA